MNSIASNLLLHLTSSMRFEGPLNGNADINPVYLLNGNADINHGYLKFLFMAKSQSI